MYSSRSLGPLLVILTFLLSAVGGYWYQEGEFLGKPWGFWRSENSLVPVQAVDRGRLVQGFPRGLIIVSDAEIVGSTLYLKRGEKREVRRAVYLSRASTPDIFAVYVSYFNDKDYASVKSDSIAGVSSLKAKKGSEEVNISIAPVAGGRKEVTVDVVTPAAKD